MFKGPPVAVGMSIDVASIDMVSEVNMVSVIRTHPRVSLVLCYLTGRPTIPTWFPTSLKVYCDVQGDVYIIVFCLVQQYST